jgi:hypothetical protein
MRPEPQERPIISGPMVSPGEPRFYIQQRENVVGNCAVWWRPAAEGYTCDLKQAGQFTVEEVRRYVYRSCDVAFPVEEVDRLAVMHVRVESLREVSNGTVPVREVSRG